MDNFVTRAEFEDLKDSFDTLMRNIEDATASQDIKIAVLER